MAYPITDLTRTNVPAWAAGAFFSILDASENSSGSHGYECHRIVSSDGEPIGWVYDTGAGYEWAGPDDGEPEPYTAAERGEG